MADFDNNMTGVLFLNDRKDTEKHPDRKGSCEINGLRYWVSGWNRQTKRGDTISLKFEPAQKAVDALPSEPKQNDPDFDDDIPF